MKVAVFWNVTSYCMEQIYILLGKTDYYASKMESLGSFQMLVNFYQIIRRNILENSRFYVDALTWHQCFGTGKTVRLFDSVSWFSC
jgi:hypothetical protein